jgi:hypothetical protein
MTDEISRCDSRIVCYFLNRRDRRNERFSILLCFLCLLLFKIVVLNLYFVLTTKDTKHSKTDERKEHESTRIFTNLISVN